MTEPARERVGSRGCLVRLDDVACEPCGHRTERMAADRRVVAHVDKAVFAVRRLVVEREHIGDVRMSAFTRVRFTWYCLARHARL